MQNPSFWDNAKKAQEVVKEKNILLKWTEPYEDLVNRLSNLKEFLPEAEASQDEPFLKELEDELMQLKNRA